MNSDQNSGERIIAKDIRRSNNGRITGLNRNDLIIGGSGAGKTTGYVAPNLNNPSGSFVVSDTKGKLYGKYCDSLKEKGYDVLLIDLVDPANSSHYNPFDYIRKYEDGTVYESDIKKLATILMPSLDSREPFWEKAATRYVCMLIGFVFEVVPEERRNMNAVIQIHQAVLAGKGDKYFNTLINNTPSSYTANKYRAFESIRTSEKTYACILEFASEALDPFDCLEFRRFFASGNSIDVHQLGKKKTALFINSSDHDKSYHVISSIISFQIIQTLLDDADKTEEGELDIPVNIYLDDFAAAAKIPDFDLLISIIRSRNISVSILLQSISQLTHMYGPEAAVTIINNCDTILYLGSGHDMETAKFIAYHANQPEHSILTLPRDTTIILTSGEKPQTAGKIKATDEITGLVPKDGNSSRSANHPADGSYA